MLHPFPPGRFLSNVYGTEPFVEYCRERQIAFEQPLSALLGKDDERRWTAALAQLPHERQAQVELDFAKVNAMAGADTTAHLLEAVEETDRPPESVPGGAPLALWFLLHHPGLFREVFFRHELSEVDCWRSAHADAGLGIADLDDKALSLAEGLRSYFRPQTGEGAFCTVDAHRMPGSICFVAQVADRLQFLQAFSDSGHATTCRLRPAKPLLFVYEPEEGSVLLMSHLRSRDRIAALFALFGRVVLDRPVAWDGCDRANPGESGCASGFWTRKPP